MHGSIRIEEQRIFEKFTIRYIRRLPKKIFEDSSKKNIF